MGAALFLSFETERTARAQARQTTIVRNLLRDALASALNAETGQRGFLLSGDPAYLAPYDDGRSRLPALVTELRAAVGAATPLQASALERLAGAAQGKLAELAVTVRLARSGDREAAVARLRTGEGARLMDEIRAAVADLVAEEEVLFDADQERVVASETWTILILALLAIGIVLLVAYALSLERRAAQAEAAAGEAEELRAARERSDLVARELNHRVKNLFAVILSMVSLSAREATDVRTAFAKLGERIFALSRAHSVSQGQLLARHVAMRDVAAATLEPYRGAPHRDFGERIVMGGGEMVLPVRSVTPLGMILHELATNAVKYGALGRPDGRVTLDWSVEDGLGEAGPVDEGPGGTTARIVWRETGGPATEAGQSGFGARMIDQATRQLDGILTRTWGRDGLRVELRFPLGG